MHQNTLILVRSERPRPVILARPKREKESAGSLFTDSETIFGDEMQLDGS